MKRTATERRAEREFGHVLDKSIYVLAFVILVFGFLPEARPLIGVLLRLLGSFIEASGSIVIAEQTERVPGVFAYKWIIAVAALLSPLLAGRLLYERGKTDGLQQTVAETKELRI